MHTKKLLFSLCAFFLCSFLEAQEYCTFISPKKWEIADPKILTSKVKMGFIGKGEKGFHPSINLALEKVTVTLPEYVKAVKAIHEADRSKRWRDLGKFETNAGEARLTEIDTQSDWGSARLLQLMFIKDDTAYILTACALKEEFSKYYREFQAAFKSLTLSEDLTELVHSNEKKELLRKKIREYKLAARDADFVTKHAEPLQKLIIEDFEEMGLCWQIQLLNSIIAGKT